MSHFVTDSSGGAAAVPQITVSVDEEGGTGKGEGTPNIKESLSYENFSFGGKKKKQEMPDPSSAQMKGYLYKKGKIGWDKVWIVLTYDNSLFMSTNETSKKVSGIIPLGPESKVEEKKSTDKKYSHALWLASGKSKETFATDSASDFKLWLTFLKQASGNADIQELLSEDEDGGGGKRDRESEHMAEFTLTCLPNSEVFSCLLSSIIVKTHAITIVNKSL